MNLQELKAMVKEEYNRFMYEQDDEDKKDDAPKGDDKPKDDKKDDGDKGAPKKAKAPKVKAGKDDIGMGGDEDPEKTLRDIFDMLKDFFEGDDKPKDDKPKMDKPKDAGAPAAGGGMDVPGGKPAGMPDLPGLELQENLKGRRNSKRRKNLLERKRKGNNMKSKLMVERFKKLANIIK